MLGVLHRVVTDRKSWSRPIMTKIDWLKFPLALLAVGKIPISNFCVYGSSCKCHFLVKPGEAVITPSRSYIPKIMAVSVNDQHFVVEGPTGFTRRRKNTYLQFLCMW